ncbi:hypothetical protein L1987_68829 [Smallanthus sonchifolius]|uniref:Uncharacterized protein n=1 Tax=Smallanthus sonchifolius TaxID=185202 RepID=A0ACB9B5V6_9ASTR|nr:hypothetical protein L1987_68829 [Smallanthus sonchifolius]
MSVSQVCDQKYWMIFTDKECFVLSPFLNKPTLEKILLTAQRKDNLYMLDMNEVTPSGSVSCFLSKASVDESTLWHRRLRHVNVKTINKLVKGNFVRGLPNKEFQLEDHCIACLKGKQHKSSHKPKTLNSNDTPLQLLHMDLFGPINVMSMGKKSYYLGGETKQSESQSHKAEAVNKACYVQNRVLIVKPLNKTSYELWSKRVPYIGFLKPFGCPCTILITHGVLPKFGAKSDERYFVGYSSQSKAYRVFNSRIRIVEKSANVECREHIPCEKGKGPD